MPPFRLAALLALVLFQLPAWQKQPPAPADYGKFESLAPPARFGGLSPDGKWLAYGINRSNHENELRVMAADSTTAKVIPFASASAYSSDSRWLAYAIGYSESQEEKFRKDKKRSERKLGLLNLATGQQTVFDGIESFAFSPDGSCLAMRRYSPEKKDAAPEPSSQADEPASSATLIVRQLATGRDTAFGNVSEFAWQDLPAGRLLALAISAEDSAGNALQLFDPSTAMLRVLDSSKSLYTGLTWRKDSRDLAALRSFTAPDRQGRAESALAWRDLGLPSEKAASYSPANDSKFPAGMRIVAYRKPSWNQSGSIVFIGFNSWIPKQPAPETDSPKTDSGAKAPAEDTATVDIWHWRDTEVMPKQKLSARANRQKNLLAVWHLESNAFVPLARSLTEQVVPLKGQNFAVVSDWTSYSMERSIGRPEADISLVDLSTGGRSKVKDKLYEDRYLQPSPGGRYLLYLENDHYWAYNVATRSAVNLTRAVKTSFVDRESDFTVEQKPPFGIAGWTANDASVILYDKYDLWQFSPDGSKATRLTDGAATQVRYRYVNLNPELNRGEEIDPARPLYLSLFGEYSKKSGYARLTLGAKPEQLVWEDKSVSRLGKARDAEVFDYAVEKFDEPPSVYLAAAALSSPRKTIATNPFFDTYAWGRGELVEYKNSHGERLQASLFYPANYEPGKKYPMVVYMYEKLSNNLHRFIAPSDREYYNASAITSRGYFLLQPDIVFRPREPGLSVEDCVSAAVKKVIASGAVDPAKIGIIGHSWGGFDSVFLAAHSHLFAAAVAGAPITDLVSNYGNHHWSSGIAETDHIETGQQRMQVPLWEDLQAYVRNSAVFHVQGMTTPLLIEVGDSDGTVFFHQGVELYNIARRAKKNVVLLEYAGEDHGLRKKADQMDYQQRIFAWFGHYLKGEPPADWITGGKSYLDRQQELDKLRTPAPSSPATRMR